MSNKTKILIAVLLALLIAAIVIGAIVFDIDEGRQSMALFVG